MPLDTMRHEKIKNKADFIDYVYPEVLCVQVNIRLKCIWFMAHILKVITKRSYVYEKGLLFDVVW